MHKNFLNTEYGFTQSHCTALSPLGLCFLLPAVSLFFPRFELSWPAPMWNSPPGRSISPARLCRTEKVQILFSSQAETSFSSFNRIGALFHLFELNPRAEVFGLPSIATLEKFPPVALQLFDGIHQHLRETIPLLHKAQDGIVPLVELLLQPIHLAFQGGDLRLTGLDGLVVLFMFSLELLDPEFNFMMCTLRVSLCLRHCHILSFVSFVKVWVENVTLLFHPVKRHLMNVSKHVP